MLRESTFCGKEQDEELLRINPERFAAIEDDADEPVEFGEETFDEFAVEVAQFLRLLHKLFWKYDFEYDRVELHRSSVFCWIDVVFCWFDDEFKKLLIEHGIEPELN